MTALYTSVETYNLSFIVLDMIIFWVRLHLLLFSQKSHQEACQVQVQQEFEATRAPAATVCLRKAKCCLDIYEEVMTSPWGGNGIFLEETQKVKHAGLKYETSVDSSCASGNLGTCSSGLCSSVVTDQCKNGRGRFKNRKSVSVKKPNVQDLPVACCCKGKETCSSRARSLSLLAHYLLHRLTSAEMKYTGPL